MSRPNLTAYAMKVASSFVDDLRDVDRSTVQEVIEAELDDEDVDAFYAQLQMVADDLDDVLDREPREGAEERSDDTKAPSKITEVG